uniref:PUB domain-containing protein n=1 Tax=Odontella aurita TaxID=265563 RepID=A0A7S4J576_9STRA|mmetsp:Transcript_38595/g.115862  ORF Transcript_38595/g.115862 Transcript_38595/m.115862 type:complete len:374 (+) Transcript_38595:194-1315(+)|eukprot:CAMPEP_0113548840 /NCGR_PEP_ID=MMETSP0015_2-20120614/13108_1 /TAXON_ID=2838 /ORGANISM="Odontella" /LENGTH=373 /DNA_ID=CAMNT_0000449497 /DNA_START=148 /DNA_END=1269 /DNA_ORIENTATION=+ /assembly_acc=CAM_ASM_000160
MELRKTEEEVNSIANAYENLRCHNFLLSGGQPDVRVDTSSLPSLDDLALPEILDRSEAEISEKDDTVWKNMGVKEALVELESIRHRLEVLREKTVRFRQRLAETDPVTNAPRYGERTMLRVRTMLGLFDDLSSAICVIFGEEESADPPAGKGHDCIVGKMRFFDRKEEEAAENLKREAEAAQANESLRRKEEVRESEETRGKEKAAAAEAKQREEAELHRRALEAKREREDREALEAQAARDADRAFMASIKKGPDGVRDQLFMLRDGTASDPKAYSTAIGALHTIFSQIAAHPEEIKFRRIRRDHPKFEEDVGRHSGGREVFVAAGFKLETLDGVPCFFSKEPDIEHDMDGWSEWFDAIKISLEIIEEEMMK